MSINSMLSIIKNYMPEKIRMPCIILLFIYLLFLSTLSISYYLAKDKTFLYALFIATSVIAIVLAIYFLVYLKKNKTIPASNTISTYIVESTDKGRDDKFNDINMSASKSYYVLGSTLSSLSANEHRLTRFAKDNIKIRLCMMNFESIMNSSCEKSISLKRCAIKRDNIKADNNYIDILKDFNIILETDHVKKYFESCLDYKYSIEESCKRLKEIKRHIDNIENIREDAFLLKATTSFIPISMTIIDHETEDGRMIVEFHIPFSKHKLFFELSQAVNKDLFKLFFDFYETIWKLSNKI